MIHKFHLRENLTDRPHVVNCKLFNNFKRKNSASDKKYDIISVDLISELDKLKWHCLMPYYDCYGSYFISLLSIFLNEESNHNVYTK